MTVPEYIYQQLRISGVTPEGACGVLGNVQAESAFIVNNVEDGRGWSDDAYTTAVDNGSYTNFAGDSIGYGIYQLTYGSRKRKFLEYVKSKGKSIGDLETQVSFMIKEFKEDFGNIWNLICSSHDLVACTDKLLEVWENPTVRDYANRRNNAQNWYAKVDSLEANVGKASNTPNTSTGGGAQRMTKEQAVEKVLNIARAEIGYHEIGDNWNKYADELDKTDIYNGPKNCFPYCDVFFDWLFYKAFGNPLGREIICQPARSAGAGCLYSAQYYKQAGRWRTTSPEPGDQIFFTYAPGEYSHTGIVETVSGGVVTTIEGNTSDQVARRQYQVGSSNIAGYGVPKWELATGSSSSGSVTPSQPSSGGSVTPSAPPSYGGIIRKGAKGAKVRELQENLIKLGFSCGPDGADGDFGNNTRAAVIEFQKKAFPNEPVEWDGEVGPKTQAAIEKALAEMDKPEEKEEPVETATAVLTPTPAKEYNTGDYVNFKGGPYYSSPLTTTALHATPGRAKIISIRRGTKHPYRLQRVSKQGTNVNGWVDADSIEED